MTDLGTLGILHALNEARVEFVVVGGISAVLQGAPITTLDVDIVHDRSPENVERLHGVLRTLEAYYRIRPDLRKCPSPGDLKGPGHHLLATNRGPLDVLGALATGETFAELGASSVKVAVGDLEVRVQSLESLIRVKETLGSEKDLAVLPTLRSTLEEIHRTRNNP